MCTTGYLLIDAYNVICATDRQELLEQSMDAARDQLADEALLIHDAGGVRVALILDSPKDRLEVQHPFQRDTFEYLYAPAALSADGVIERIIVRASRADLVSVVSNDNLIREATRAQGALALAAGRVLSMVKSLCSSYGSGRGSSPESASQGF